MWTSIHITLLLSRNYKMQDRTIEMNGKPFVWTHLERCTWYTPMNILTQFWKQKSLTTVILFYSCHRCFNVVKQGCVLIKRGTTSWPSITKSNDNIAVNSDYTYLCLVEQILCDSNHECPCGALWLKNQEWMESGIELYLPSCPSPLFNEIIIHNNLWI